MFYFFLFFASCFCFLFLFFVHALAGDEPESDEERLDGLRRVACVCFREGKREEKRGRVCVRTEKKSKKVKNEEEEKSKRRHFGRRKKKEEKRTGKLEAPRQEVDVCLRGRRDHSLLNRLEEVLLFVCFFVCFCFFRV